MLLIIRSRTLVAEDIVQLELVSPSGQPLPPFEAGAHIDLMLGNALARSYSLLNAPGEHHRYVIAVNRDPHSRGGSRYIHDELKTGQTIEIHGPRNHFTLVENAELVVLIAGGIGVTPLLSMIRRLETLGRNWRLHYATRNRGKCAYLAELDALEAERPGRVHLHFDEEAGHHFDVAAAIAGVPASAHLYCCGPGPMLHAFEKAAASRPARNVHVEYFTAQHDAAIAGGYTVTLARSGKTFAIPTGKTILGVLQDNGIAVSYSCQEGVCGACETAVLEGAIDHRDSYLTPAEQKSGKKMMICCSGCASGKLVLDL